MRSNSAHPPTKPEETHMKKPVKHLSIYEVTELTRYQDAVEKRIRNQREKYENFKYAMQHALDTISNMTRKQLELGVAVIDANAAYAAEQLRMPIEPYCKAIQHQAGKPFVVMTERTNSPSPKWSLCVPKLKDQGMENLIAPLLVVGQPVEKQASYTDHRGNRINYVTHFEDGIHYEDNKHGWTIWFVGEENEEMRLHWLDMCRTEQVFRLCLRMPAAPVDLSVYGL
jgi:hypothetical protein